MTVKGLNRHNKSPEFSRLSFFQSIYFLEYMVDGNRLPFMCFLLENARS